MSKLRKLLVLVLALAMILSLGAFTVMADPAEGEAEETAAAEETADAGERVVNEDTPLVVGYSFFNSKFSPFFAETAYDQDVQRMTQIDVLGHDRAGAIVYKGIQGETHEYNGTEYTYYGPTDLEITENEDGTVYYDFTLRDDLVFSDGVPVTVDDIIFSMYVLCDPTYDGSATLFSQPIQGLADYRSGMDTLFNLIMAAGEDNDDFSLWTEEQQAKLFEEYNAGKAAFVEEIKAYLVGAGANAEDDTYDLVMANWGFEVPEDATAEEVFDIVLDAYDGDVAAMVETESAGMSLEDMIPSYDEYTMGVETGNAAESISGIQKIDDYHLRIVADQVDATMVYQFEMAICPLHYYGDPELFDIENNSFGFPKGDLSMIREKTTEPLGAGPYKFVKYDNSVVNFEANESFYLGAPKIKYMNFRESSDQDKLNGVVTGTLDITDPSFNADAIEAIKQANGGELDGDVIVTDTVDNLGYGYIGINSHNVSVGGDPASEESRNLRRAFATIFSVYRDVAIDTYYGEIASVINYPISNTSWAAPQPADDGYEIAFSTDVDGNPIYTSDMDADARYEAALDAALGFFEAAGYTVEDGKITEAPEGAKMEYEVMIPADGSGDHPSFMILTLARDALKEIGITLTVNDLSNSSDLWTALEAEQGEIWCAAWGASLDPDMYQVYYSDIANGGAEPGGSNYMYQIEDAELDEMILEARTSTNQEFRKAMYKACLDTIIDWACEIPVYQRQNAIIFSNERVNIDTVTPDITTFYNWYEEIENLELK